MATNTPEDRLIDKTLSELSTEYVRTKVLDVKLTFVPVNLKALEIALGGKLVFTISTDEARELAKASLKAQGIALTEKELQDIKREAKNNKPKEERLKQDIYEKRVREISNYVFDFSDFRHRIITWMETNHRSKIYIKNSQFYSSQGIVLNAEDIKNLSPCVVYENNTVIGGLYSSFGSAKKSLFTSFINKELAKFVDDKIVEGTEYDKGFDIGHILGESELTETPLGKRLQILIDKLKNISTDDTAVPEALLQVKDTFNKLKEQSTYGSEIIKTLSQDTQGALKSVSAVVVIVQERVENQYRWGSLIEAKAGTILKGIILPLINKGFSKSLKENIVSDIKQTLQLGKITTTGRKKSVKTVIPRKKVVSKPKVTTSIQKSVTNISVVKKSLSKIRAVELTDDADLLGLQNILNVLLPKQVRQNMGDGSRTDILNYRTGRFAESVKVKDISRSRAGMVSVYYDYMKNPYATFSEGGKQQSPRSRDPKLLISKSIREILQQQMITRMRAVLV